MKKILTLISILIFTATMFAIAQAQTATQYQSNYAIICRNEYFQENLCNKDIETCKKENSDCRIVYEKPMRSEQSGITAAITAETDDYKRICCITDIKAYDTTKKRCAELKGTVFPHEKCYDLICCNNRGTYSKMNIMKCTNEGGKETSMDKCNIVSDTPTPKKVTVTEQQSQREIICCKTLTQTFYTTKAICRNLRSTTILPYEVCQREVCCGVGINYEKMSYFDCLNKAGREVSFKLCGVTPAEELPLSIFSKETQNTICCADSTQAYYATAETCKKKGGTAMPKDKCQTIVCCDINGLKTKMNFMECISTHGQETAKIECENIIKAPKTLSSAYK